MNRKTKDIIAKGCIFLSAGFTILILCLLIGFVLIKGLPGISLDFLTRDYEDKTTYVMVSVDMDTERIQAGESNELKVTLKAAQEGGLTITSMLSDSPLKTALDMRNQIYEVKKGDIITDASEMEAGVLRLRIVRPGGGIIPMLITTFYMIVLSILIAAPIGILSAVYLVEYARPGKIKALIHFAIQNLSGIPSIIYGLFGSFFFVKICKFQYSLLAGALTLSIMILPVIITTTEEALKTIPKTYIESSFGLGATKLQTIAKIILPGALPGILAAVLLSVGRVIGESAALLLTAGTVTQIPKALTGSEASGATLTIKLYTLMKEENDLTTACAIGIVLLILIIGINLLTKKVSRGLMSKRRA